MDKLFVHRLGQSGSPDRIYAHPDLEDDLLIATNFCKGEGYSYNTSITSKSKAIQIRRELGIQENGEILIITSNDNGISTLFQALVTCYEFVEVKTTNTNSKAQEKLESILGTPQSICEDDE